MEQTATLNSEIYSDSSDFERKFKVGFWLVITVLCLLPFERLMFPFGIRVVDFALVVLILHAFIRFLILHKRIYLPLLLPAWLILVGSIISVLNGLMHHESILAVLQEIYIYIWFIFLTNVLIRFSQVELNKLLKIWSVIAVVEATFTVMGMLSIGPSIFYVSPVDGKILSMEGFNRGLGTYINPNAAAAYLSISFFVLLATQWPVWLRALFGTWLMIGIYATGSNGGLYSTLIAFASLIVFYLAIKPQRLYLFWVIFIGVVATAFTLLVINDFLIDPYEGGFVSENKLVTFLTTRFSRSVVDRMAIIEKAWSVYRDYPFGTGPNTSTLIYKSLHNDYFAFLIERGPLGLIGFLWIMGATLIKSLRMAYWKKDGFNCLLMLSLGMGFFSCAINAFVHEITHFRQVWVLMAFIFATYFMQSHELG